MPRHDTDDLRRDMDWITSPQRWTAFPLCPVKRYETRTEQLKEMQLGVVVADSIFGDDDIEVILTNIWAFDPRAESIKYDTVLEMLHDGWMVD